MIEEDTQTPRAPVEGRSPTSTDSADQYMEEISDKIRRGEPVGFMDALAAIEYQRQRKLQGPTPFWERVIRFFLPNVELARGANSNQSKNTRDMTQPKNSQSGRNARVTSADLFDYKVRMVYNRMIARRLKPGAEISVCLPCYQIYDWDRAKEVIDKSIPDGWSSRWGEKKGVLILSNAKGEAQPPTK